MGREDRGNEMLIYCINFVSVDIAENETPESLKDKVQLLEQQCFVEALNMVISGQIKLGE